MQNNNDTIDILYHLDGVPFKLYVGKNSHIRNMSYEKSENKKIVRHVQKELSFLRAYDFFNDKKMQVCGKVIGYDMFGKPLGGSTYVYSKTQDVWKHGENFGIKINGFEYDDQKLPPNILGFVIEMCGSEYGKITYPDIVSNPTIQQYTANYSILNFVPVFKDVSDILGHINPIFCLNNKLDYDEKYPDFKSVYEETLKFNNIGKQCLFSHSPHIHTKNDVYLNGELWNITE